MPKNDSRKILIVAAEASSCLYAQRLLEHWRQQGVAVEAFGIGNKDMAELGFECLAHAEDLAVVGLQEVLAHWSVIKKAFYDCLAAAENRRPQVVLLLDYPGFNLRLAKRIKALGIPLVYYISPQVWAWRQGRVKTIKSLLDKLLVVFPFEVDFYQKFQVPVEFVGHPLLDELKRRNTDAGARDRYRAKFGLGPSDVVLGLMPGSRNSELNHHLQIQLDTAHKLLKKFPHLKPFLMVAPNFNVEAVRARLGELQIPLTLIKDEPFAMIDLADVVLCASGTATLMVGLLEKPMVIMYKMNPVTAFLAKRFVKATRYFGLINLVLDQGAVPEVFQEQANAIHLAEMLSPMVADPEVRREIGNHLRPAKERLGSAGATVRVAQALEPYWN